jgi:hypothetical protein
VAEIKQLYAYHLFNDGQHARAMELFFELGTNPLEVIGLYPNLLPKNMLERHEYPIEISVLGNISIMKNSVPFDRIFQFSGPCS